MRRRCQRRVITRKPLLTEHPLGDSRPATHLAPDAVASIAPQPGVGTCRAPAFLLGLGFFAYATNPNLGKVEFFCDGGLTKGGDFFAPRCFPRRGAGLIAFMGPPPASRPRSHASDSIFTKTSP